VPTIKLGRFEDPSGTTITAAFIVKSDWQRWIRLTVRGVDLEVPASASGAPRRLSETIAIKSPAERDGFCDLLERFLDGEEAEAEIEIGPHKRAACRMHRDASGALSISGMGRGYYSRKGRVALEDEEKLRILIEVLRVQE